MEGVPKPNCIGKFCNVLPQPVYPTPLYEVIAAFILFLILWNIRHKIKLPGMMFGVYLIFNGVERFLIELIRVNSKYTLFGLSFTQAELIAVILVLSGLALVIFAVRNKERHASY
ncbi:Prolipoprotein diacylglyceryl transferase [compost metagenome]